MWNNHLYIRRNHLSFRAHRGSAAECWSGRQRKFLSINIRGVAPYWRLAWQQTSKNNNLEVGTYGMHVKSTPRAPFTGLEDSYTDWAVDFQYDRTIPQFRRRRSFDPRHVHPRKFIAGRNGLQHSRGSTDPASPQYRPGERGVSLRRQVIRGRSDTSTSTARPILLLFPDRAHVTGSAQFERRPAK